MSILSIAPSRSLASIFCLTLPLAACALPEILGKNPELTGGAAETDPPGETAATLTASSPGSVSETASEGGSVSETASEGGSVSEAASEGGSVSETATEGGTTTAAPSETSSGGTSTGEETDAPPVMCSNPAHACTIPVDCEQQWGCGALGNPFDADGCLRRSCDHSPCGPGEVCYEHDLVGGCSFTVLSCADGDGVCECEISMDCGGRYCYPAGEAPPSQCTSMTDEASCLGSGCSEWKEPQLLSIANGQCTCGETIPACLWFPDPPGLVDAPGVFYHVGTFEVVVFPQAWIDPPLGWAPCTGAPGEPAECACATPGEDPCP